jgi:hypothetical protein
MQVVRLRILSATSRSRLLICNPARPSITQPLLGAELYGRETVVMDGRILRAGGRVVTLDGKSGVFFEKSKEEEALYRWQEHEFLDLER